MRSRQRSISATASVPFGPDGAVARSCWRARTHFSGLFTANFQLLVQGPGSMFQK